MSTTAVALVAGMLLRTVVPVLALGVVFAGLLAAAHLVLAKTSPSTPATALDGGGVLAALSAVLAALVCLLALSNRPHPRPGGERRIQAPHHPHSSTVTARQGMTADEPCEGRPAIRLPGNELAGFGS
ncbi:hypothetical protein ACN24L_34105 [Streptomyces microflavus]